MDGTQSLLRWGIEHAAPGALPKLAEDMKAGRRPDLNTDMLKAIMGTSDADRMKECVEVIEGRWVDRDGGGVKDADVTKEDRLRAWDDLEMLVEDLDNANDLKFLNLWAPILKYTTDEDEEIALRACWVCGTAVQNNPRAQSAFLELDPLPTIISLLLSRTLSPAARNKAMYAISSTLKLSEPAVMRFAELDGWNVLHQTLLDPSPTLRTKTAFLLCQLASQSPPLPFLTSLRPTLLPALLLSLTPSALPTGPNGDGEVDLDYREKALRVCVNLAERLEEVGGALGEEEKVKLRSVVRALEGGGEGAEAVGLAVEEWEVFRKRIGA